MIAQGSEDKFFKAEKRAVLRRKGRRRVTVTRGRRRR
jgi:hypothetical protein